MSFEWPMIFWFLKQLTFSSNESTYLGRGFLLQFAAHLITTPPNHLAFFYIFAQISMEIKLISCAHKKYKYMHFKLSGFFVWFKIFGNLLVNQKV